MNTCILDIIESIAIIIASLSAIYGINSWRKEMKGKKEYELAEEVLAHFYEAKDKISLIRSISGWSGEGKSRKPSQNETDEEKKILDQAHVVFERYQNNQDVFNKLQSLRYRFMAVFGRENGNPFIELNKIIIRILSSSRTLSRLYFLRRQDDSTQNKIDKYEAIIYEGHNEPDEISQNIENILSEIEHICENIIRPEEKWYSRNL